MGYWEFIKPEATTNLLTDPSFALADPDTEWDIGGDGAAPDFTRTTARAKFGLTSAEADIDDGTYAYVYQSPTVTATSYTLSAYVRRYGAGTVTATHTSCRFDSSWDEWDSITQIDNGWWYCERTATATAGVRTFGVRCNEDQMRVDGVQLENKAYATTYCDGTQEGCYWNGAENASTSTRSAMSRAGGRVYDFEDDYSFNVVDWQGWGVPPHLLNLDRYAVLPGASINNIKTDVNQLTLTGWFKGSSLSNLHTLRQALVEELAHDRYPQTAEGWQPIRIRYTGATVTKEAKVFYDSGLEGSSMVGRAYNETIPIRFLMADPFWYEIGESANILDTNDSATLRYLGGRLRSTGQWDDLGLTANPAANGTINTICVASDGSVYFGGDFDGINNDGAPADAGCDYVVRFDPSDESWNVLVGASDVNGEVHHIIEGPDGTIYLCGAFTDVNGAGHDYIVAYDPSADTWSGLDDPDSGAAVITAAYEMAFDSDGNLYVVGNFTNWNDVAAADYIAKWNGASWSAVGAPSVGAGAVLTIAIDSADNIVIGGTFTNFAGDGDADYLAIYNGTSWADLGSGTQTTQVNDLVFDDSDILYIGGTFTNQGGDADCDYFCAWNGTQFIPLDTGPGGTVYDIAIGHDGIVFIAGDFAGSAAGSCGLSAWNGSAWVRWDLDTEIVLRAVAIGKADQVVRANYDIYIGATTSAAQQIAGDATVTNDGTAAQYPQIIVTRSGGTSATLDTVRNETTGQALMFDYGLLDGETLTIDCRPGKKSITSSMFGSRPDAILANSDFGIFALQADANTITAFVEVEGAPTITTYLLWKDAYRGMD